LVITATVVIFQLFVIGHLPKEPFQLAVMLQQHVICKWI
jgi:hypothetical protein